ncbi:LysR family transcriptional regulator [Acinetobacter puyangensis]|uniref:DNA-binding transcriptional regulator, LysR family n=1 Tax=Acinetobacter puyangensis TaxID=1096779 RepID=A0A240E2X0_9GAMM|nr:LysR family transcriptional regulator [Acinetobacter puyangensis]SNX43127.1 DNA-binding transcriptional regulator, LysR family [Acinetobacter puyangensis]
MDLFEQIKIFKAIVDFGSFSEASRQLGISLSAVSRQLENLEQYVGVPLLRRTTRKLHLTEVGSIYYRESIRILRDIDGLHQQLKEHQAEPQGHLRITVSNLLGHLKLTPLIPDFLSLYPKIHLEINYSDRIVDIVGEGFDIAIRSGTLEDSTLVAMKLGSNKHILCASKAYWERKSPPEKIADFLTHNIISFKEGLTEAPWFYREANGPWKKIKLKGDISVNQGLEYKALVRSGLGVGLLLEWMIDEELKTGELVPVLTEIEVSYSQDIVSDIFAVYSKDRFDSPKLKVFLEFIKQRINLNL